MDDSLLMRHRSLNYVRVNESFNFTLVPNIFSVTVSPLNIQISPEAAESRLPTVKLRILHRDRRGVRTKGVSSLDFNIFQDSDQQ